ncbi:TetR/AcrR family transcriptional regulator [Kribbella sp. NPDC026611]|uniref:TetR/AcrR family transcriptional regulator n=1 Tax=Kribbella sp. NPDC026611 TaxID=3154911 RepID=UPI0034032E00
MARAGLTADRLASAGAELADSLGFDQVTVSAVARHFGVQVASLYSHVKNSADLKTRIATVALTELADLASAAVAGRATHDALTALANTHRTYAQSHPGRYTATRYTPPTSPDRAQDLARAIPPPSGSDAPPTSTSPASSPTSGSLTSPVSPDRAHRPARAIPPTPGSTSPASSPASGSVTSPTSADRDGFPASPASGSSTAATSDSSAPSASGSSALLEQAGGGTSSSSVLGKEFVAAGRRHAELARAILRGYDLDEPAQTDAVRLIGSLISGYITLEQAGSFAYSQPSPDDSWPRILDALDCLLRTWPERHPS